MPSLRFSLRAILATLTAAALFFASIGLEIARARNDAAIVERLSAFGVSVYTSKSTFIGKVAEKLPWIEHDALSYPQTLLATGVSASDVDSFVREARELHVLECLVVMEYQFGAEQREVVDKLRNGLPYVKVTEAAFISGVIYTR